jgi:pilin isopeptide linkage protein
VTVTDDGSGTLKVQYDGQDTFTAPTMTNTYGATGKAELSILKALSTGAKPAAGKYTFELEDSEGKALQTKSNDADGKVTFDAITYTLSDLGGEASKEFTYRIHESSAAASGWTNAPDKTVTVTVTDDGSGTLKVQYDGQDTFTAPTMTNTYGATGKAELSILKALSTGAKPAAGKYTFELEDSEGKALQTKSNDADGKVTFDAITYTLSDLGGEASKEFTYTIHESSAAASGWTNAPDKTVTVTVTDDGSGTLKVQYDGQDTFTAPTMTNTYGATGKAELSILKALSTGAKPAAGKYTFELEDSEGKALQTKSNDADGKVTFDAITYTLSDLGGEASKEFTYTIHESSAAASGWTNAPDKTVTVTVTDDGSGTLKVQYDGQDTFTVPTMTNTYAAAGSAQLKVDKNFTGRDWAEGDKFTFTLTGEKDAPMPTGDDGNTLTIAYSSTRKDHSGLFGEISYTKAGVYTYDITEKASGLGGVTDDATTHKAVVTVEDKDYNGKFTITVKYDNTDSDAAVFTDTYAASGSTQLKVDKNFTGRDWAVGDKFTFTLTGEKDAPMPTDTAGNTLTIAYSSTSKDYSGLFGEINYTAAGTYTYDITENASGIAGVTDDTTTHKAVVTVEDKDHNGKFTITVKYDNTDSDAAVFTDTYAAYGSTQLKVDKNFTGRDWAEGDKFTFALTGEKDAPMPKEDSGKELTIAYSSTSKDHSGLFGEISYTKAGVYTYDITEKASGLGGVTDDATTHKAVVTVEDKDYNGKFTITVKYDNTDSDAAAFTDTYAASGSTQLKVDKNFTGRDWAIGDKFTFTLKAEENAPMPTGADGNTLTITYDSKDHTGLFGEISYTKAGTYTYDITENASGLGGVTDDKMTHHAVVTVEDKDHNGKFTISVKYDNTDKDAAVFTDTYGAVGSITFSGTKTLKDGTLSGNEFSFTVKEGDSIVATGTNDKNGKITFTSIPYTLSDVGEHTYTVTETVGTKDGVQYDTTCYTVTVKVTDNHDGTLKIEPSSDYTKLNFTNTISSTTTSTTSTTSSSSVKTGDDSPIALYFILLLFSGAAAALFVTDMKKKKNSGNQ